MSKKSIEHLRHATKRALAVPGRCYVKTSTLRSRTIIPAHNKLEQRFDWYKGWHQWSFKKLNHKHIHWSVAICYGLALMLFLLLRSGMVLAADYTDSWNFSNIVSFLLDNGVEQTGSSVGLKPQAYTTDGNTSALFHFDETNGTSADDVSTNNNDLTTVMSPNFVAGKLNNALNLNGTNQYASAPDSPSLSMTGQQSLEAWIKPSQTFDNNSNSSQTIIDKGSYRLGLDRTSGKAFYEIQNNNAQWTKQLGGGMNGSWEFNHARADSMVSHGTNIYVGLGQVAGDAEVWKWNGTSWEKIGGDGIRSGWADNTYESVMSMAVNGSVLYVGLGTDAGDGDVWSCELNTGCNSWTKIGGDGTGIGINTYTIDSMTVHNGSLYVGTGGGIAYGKVYRYNGGTSWTKVAGDGVSGSWATNTYPMVASLHSDGTYLYAGTGNTASKGDVWRYDGSNWVRIGGSGLNNSWNHTNFYSVRSMVSLNGKLYAGLGDSGNYAQVYYWDGSTWTNTNIGLSGSITQVQSLASDGTNIYASRTGAGAQTTNTGSVARWDGSSWTLIAGSNSNGSWAMASGVPKLLWANSKLYATAWTNANGNGSMVWEMNGANWTQIGGSHMNGSWNPYYSLGAVESSTTHAGKLYFGLSGATSTASSNASQVYEYDGENAQRIGGSGLNGSWPAGAYEGVYSMASYKGSLYVGLGNSTGDGEVWKWDGSIWSKVGGDGVNGSWGSTNKISAMMVWRGNLYVGFSGVVSNQIWQYDGSSWSRADNGWSPNMYTIYDFAIYNDQLCASGGGGGSPGQLYCWSGSGSWTHIGGNDVNGSWSSTATSGGVSIEVFNGKLVALYVDATIGVTAWEWDGATWTQIGGNLINGSWDNSGYTLSIARSPITIYNGELYVGMYGSTVSKSDVWRYDGSSWVQVGGSGINNSWSATNNIEMVSSLTVYKGKMYAGLGLTVDQDALVYSFGDNGYVETDTDSFDSNWHHLAGTYDGSSMKIYVDGALKGTSAKMVSGKDNNSPLLIGHGFGSGTEDVNTSPFAGQIDEVRISNIARSSFTYKPYLDTEQSVTLSDPIRTSGISTWVGFSANETTNGGAITYRLSSDNGATWKYWSGGAWSSSSSLAQSSSASDVNAHIDDFPVTFSGLRWQAVLKGDGNQKVTLNSVEVTSDADGSAPNTNASNLQAFSSNGGAEIGSTTWTNVSTPYFSWNSATDAGSDIYGYCLYLGQTASSNPVSSKGLLGTSPKATGGHCQYVVPTTSLDLSQPGVLTTPLATSDDSYYLNVKAIDSAGNVYGSSEQFEFKFDNTAPTNPSFISAPSEFVSSKEVTFTWPTSGADAPNDDNSNIAGLQYRIGANGTWRGDGVGGTGNLTNDGSYTTRDNPDYADINNGNNVFYFRTVDVAGNVSTSYVSATLRLNTGAPTGPQNVSATPGTNTSNSFGFSWDPPATYAGSASSLTYCYTINTLPTENTCTFTGAGVTSLSAGAYATQPGENTFYVVARDNNINYATASSTTFTANTSAPGMPLDLEIADISTKATNSWKIALSWSEPTDIGAGVASYKVYRSNTDSNYTQVASTAGTSFVDSGLSQQTYYYKVKACDSANNCGALSSNVNKYPTGRFTTPANATSNPEVSNVSTRKATVRWSTDRVSDSKVSIGTAPGQYEPFQIANGDQVTDHSVSLTNLTPGTTYFAKASWTDEDGNTGNSSEFTFQTSPAPSTQEVITSRVGLSSALVRFTSVSSARVVIQYGKSDSFGGVKEIATSLSRSTYDVELTGLDDNSKYFYRLNTYDADGNEYIGSTVLTFTTPARPRISDLRFEPVEGEPTSTQRVTWNTNVDTTSGVTYGKEGTNGVDILNSALTREHEIIIRGLDDNSIYFLIAQSRDVDGNLATSDRQAFQTALDTRPPAIKDLAVETIVKGTGSDARGQIVVTWTTDEPSTSQVAFGEGTSAEGVTSMTTEDANLTTEHVVIISDLSTAKVYNVQAISRDKARNEAKSESQSTIINRGTESILSIIVNVLQRIFGFEVN